MTIDIYLFLKLACEYIQESKDLFYDNPKHAEKNKKIVTTRSRNLSVNK